MHMRFWGGTVGTNLPAALEIYADILRRPHLPEEEMDAVKELALQDLRGLEDEPGSKVLVELRKHFYPTPLSNDSRGTPEGIEALTAKEVRRHHAALFRPQGTILSVAGHLDWDRLRDQVGRLFGDWQGSGDRPLNYGPPPEKRAHITKDLEQTQIAVACPSVPIGHPDYYAALGAVNVLSGGMSARLFTELREKEGLCYSVWASYQTLKDRATVVAFAASLNDQAQRSLDLLLRELNRLPEGVSDEEVQRVRVGLKTSLIMQQESTAARAGSLASDWYYLGRVRTVDEIGGHRRPDARGHHRASAPLPAGGLQHRHPGAAAAGGVSRFVGQAFQPDSGTRQAGKPDLQWDTHAFPQPQARQQPPAHRRNQPVGALGGAGVLRPHRRPR
jgi:predicted Zn-dependent peptidase